jgi:hypothetical protein
MGTTKSGHGQENTVNQGPAPERRREEEADITGNVKERGQDPSPGDRERGERSGADKAAPIDADTAHERAQ